jgi:SAM-dependent methyltransferase
LAELRLSFGNAAADYERGRPGWPAEIAEVGELPRDAHVLDLGAGTGKLTQILARRFAEVTAVEPDASMRAVLSQVTDCHLVLEGSAEAIPLEDRSVDGVFCAEAFHWFDWPAALREISQVLRPRGVLVLCWNVPRGQTEPPYPEPAREVVRRYERPDVQPGGPIYQSGVWREPFADTPFEPLRDEAFEWEFVQDRDAVVGETLSVSIFAQLPEDDRMRMGEELHAALPEADYRTPMRTEVTWTRLR